MLWPPEGTPHDVDGHIRYDQGEGYMLLLHMYKGDTTHNNIIWELQPPFDTDEVDLILRNLGGEVVYSGGEPPKLVRLERGDALDNYLARSLIIHHQTKIDILRQLNGFWNFESVQYSEVQKPVDDIFDTLGFPLSRRIWDWHGPENGEFGLRDVALRAHIQLNNDTTLLALTFLESRELLQPAYTVEFATNIYGKFIISEDIQREVMGITWTDG